MLFKQIVQDVVRAVERAELVLVHVVALATLDKVMLQLLYWHLVVLIKRTLGLEKINTHKH